MVGVERGLAAHDELVEMLCSEDNSKSLTAQLHTVLLCQSQHPRSKRNRHLTPPATFLGKNCSDAAW